MLTPADQAEILYGPATFSPCRAYRYSLYRPIHDRHGPPVLFLMLNPSTADETKLDPTVTRCCRFASDWLCARMYVANIFALRSTDPRAMKSHPHPVDLTGSLRNDTVIRMLAEHVALHAGWIVCAWGAHGTHRGRADTVRRLLAGLPLRYLALTAGGQPRHPLYLRADLKPTRWTDGASNMQINDSPTPAGAAAGSHASSNRLPGSGPALFSEVEA